MSKIAVEQPKSIAFYYPGPLWRSGNAVKNLLLFFDGVGLLVPAYMREELEAQDGKVLGAVRDAGLLHVLEPETVVDKAATVKLASTLADLLASGALDSLTAGAHAFEEISMSRLGFYGDVGLANMIFEELERRGLAKKSADGVSIPLHPTVRALVLCLLAQILRGQSTARGLDLVPATDQAPVVHALGEMLSLPTSASAGHVVQRDLEVVGVDLAKVPVEEVLAFRKEHRANYLRYATGVRRFLRDASLQPEPERQRAVRERDAELREMARDLAKQSAAAWKKPAGFALSALGAAWTASTGDPTGAALALGGSILALEKGKNEVGAYSYLFDARSKLA